MADILLFHHAQGLTDGVHAFADDLRTDGHRVTTPDLYAGRTFDDLDAGVGYARETGFDTVLERGRAAAEGRPEDLVYIGMSLGALPAQSLTQTRPGARGAVLLHGCVPAEEFGAGWPVDVPVQIHGMAADPIFVGDGDVIAARALVDAVEDAELFLYPGDQHLFSDRSLAAYDADAAKLLTERVLAFLTRLG